MAESDSDSDHSSVGSNTSILNSFAAHDNVNEDEFLNGDPVENELMENNDANNVIVDDFLNGDPVENELMENNDANNVNEDEFLNGNPVENGLMENNDGLGANNNVINNTAEDDDFMNRMASNHDEMKKNENELVNGLIGEDENMIENGLRSVAEGKINNNNDVVENQLDDNLVQVEGEGNGLNEQQIAVAQDPIVEVDRQDSDSSSSSSDHDTPN